MKYVATFLLVLFLSTPAFAGSYTAIKTGAVDMEVKANNGWVQEIACGYDWEKVNVEASIGHWASKVKSAGSLHVFPLLIHLRYAVFDNFLVGFGVGRAFTGFAEAYSDSIQADVDDENIACASVVYRWKDWFIESRYMFGDLDIESNHPYVETLESRSNLRSIAVMVGMRY